MADMAKSTMIRKRGSYKKQGSALVLTTLTLAFLLVLLSGITLDRTQRYWLSSHRRDELVSFYNAQSAYEQGEFELCNFFLTHGNLATTVTSSFILNDGTCRYQWELNDEELCLQGIGTYKKNYSLLQSTFQAYQSSADSPLLMITQELSGDGTLLLKHNALENGIFLLAPSKQLRSSDGTPIQYLLHYDHEQTNYSLCFEEISAWQHLSATNPVYERDGFFVDQSMGSNPKVSDLLDNHIYLSRESLRFDVREEEDLIEIPSFITTESIEIVARPEQTIRCTGLLYTPQLKISQGKLLLEPTVAFSNWLQNNKELVIPLNYRPTPQFILARTDFRFLPQRAVGE